MCQLVYQIVIDSKIGLVKSKVVNYANHENCIIDSDVKVSTLLCAVKMQILMFATHANW